MVIKQLSSLFSTGWNGWLPCGVLHPYHLKLSSVGPAQYKQTLFRPGNPLAGKVGYCREVPRAADSTEKRAQADRS